MNEYGFGVDTASFNEIIECILAGLHAERITITAAVKNEAIMSRKDPLGLTQIEEKVYGEAKVYPYFNLINQDKFIEKVITGQMNCVPFIVI